MQSLIDFLKWIFNFFIYTSFGVFFVIIFALLAVLTLPVIWVCWFSELFGIKFIDLKNINDNETEIDTTIDTNNIEDNNDNQTN